MTEAKATELALARDKKLAEDLRKQCSDLKRKREQDSLPDQSYEQLMAQNAARANAEKRRKKEEDMGSFVSRTISLHKAQLLLPPGDRTCFYPLGGMGGFRCGYNILPDSASSLCTDHHGKCTSGHSVWWKRFLSLFKGQMSMKMIEKSAEDELQYSISKLVITPAAPAVAVAAEPAVVPVAKKKRVSKPRVKKTVVQDDPILLSDGENGEVDIGSSDARAPEYPPPRIPNADADDAVVPTSPDVRFTAEERAQLDREVNVDHLKAVLASFPTKPPTAPAEMKKLVDDTQHYREELAKYHNLYKHGVPLDGPYTMEAAAAALLDCKSAAEELRGCNLTPVELNKAMMEVTDIERKKWLAQNAGRHAEARQLFGRVA